MAEGASRRVSSSGPRIVTADGVWASHAMRESLITNAIRI